MDYLDKEADELDEITNEFKADNFINTSIAADETPYLIQRSTLIEHSDYFRDQLEHGHEPTFRFPDDSIQVWKVIFYWLAEEALLDLLINRFTPGTDLALNCYAAGEKYGIKAFQDEIMLAVIWELYEDSEDDKDYLDEMDAIVGGYMLKVFQSTKPDSKLRYVFVEMAAGRQYSDNDHAFGLKLGWEDIKALAALGFLELFEQIKVEESCPWNERQQPQPWWSQYMVGPEERYLAAHERVWPPGQEMRRHRGF